MPTINQLVRKSRVKPTRRNKVPAMVSVSANAASAPVSIPLRRRNRSSASALDAQQHMPLAAPVIGEIAGSVLHHADAKVPEVAGLPIGCSCLTFVLGALNLSPVGEYERDAGHLHKKTPQERHDNNMVRAFYPGFHPKISPKTRAWAPAPHAPAIFPGMRHSVPADLCSGRSPGDPPIPAPFPDRLAGTTPRGTSRTWLCRGED